VAVPNLLHPEPGLCLNATALSQALTFAFAAGVPGEAFGRILGNARLAPSSFRPECFARDLFLSDFVARCLCVRIGDTEYPVHRAALLRELSQPPSDVAVTTLRQRVLTELLEKPELVDGARRVWLKIRNVEQLLEAPDRGKRYDAIGRRVEILRAIREAIELASTAFAGARSALGRAHEFATAIAAGTGFRDLVSLLEYEENLATIDLRVRVGHDGHLRGFEIVRAEENRKNAFYVPPLRRLVARIRMFFRGYRFREAEILGRLLNRVFDGVQDAVIGLFQLGLHLEFYLAALAFRDRAVERGLTVCLPELIPGDRSARITPGFEALFNPHLLVEEHAPRPTDVQIGTRALVIVTGPNSGGKTRLLQALGIAQLLGQAGMFVPAARATLVARDGLFASLIQETVSDQPEGHLGMELLRIRRLFEELRTNSLVLMDELCSGTNPSEGEEIFRLVVELLAELEPQAFVTTHFLRFAADLARDRPLSGLEFLRVELDEHQDPTYRFVAGVAPTSLAGKTAERLGVTREALLALVADKKSEPAPPKHPVAEALPANRA